jgi:hypothetical protein
MTIFTNSGLKLYMESARAAAKAISAITQADPGVITSATHGYTTGDVLLLEVEGMSELNGRLFPITVIDADSYKLLDMDGTTWIDTSGFDAFTSGNAYKVTLGTTIDGVQEYSPSGGDPKFLETTTVNDKGGKQVVNGSNPISFGLTMQWDPGKAAQQAMIRASESGDQKGFKVQWPNGRFMLFYGSVGYAGVPGGSSQGVTTSPAAIAMAGLPTYSI